MEKNPMPPPYPADPGNGGGAYPPYAPPYNPVQPPPTQYGMNQPVPTQVVTVITQPNISDVPMHMRCPHCQQQIVTETRHTNGLLTWLLCGGMFLFLCWPCSCIPFCIDSCKDVEHTCPQCHGLLGRYKRL